MNINDPSRRTPHLSALRAPDDGRQRHDRRRARSLGLPVRHLPTRNERHPSAVGISGSKGPVASLSLGCKRENPSVASPPPIGRRTCPVGFAASVRRAHRANISAQCHAGLASPARRKRGFRHVRSRVFAVSNLTGPEVATLWRPAPGNCASAFFSTLAGPHFALNYRR
jgi:hypothetical protein